MQNLKRRARIASCLAISLLASALFAKEAPSSAKDPLEPALAALRTLQYQRAIGLFDTAANAGNTRAQYLLGLIYLNGVGVAADPARARALLRSAAEHGHGAAAYVLAGELARDTPPDPPSGAWSKRQARGRRKYSAPSGTSAPSGRFRAACSSPRGRDANACT